MKVEGIPEGFTLDFLTEPGLIVTLRGTIYLANAACRSLLGKAINIRCAELFDLVRDDKENVIKFLRQSSGSTSPIFGSLTFIGSPDRYRAEGSRLSFSWNGSILILIRLHLAVDHNFSVLNRRVIDLDRQLRDRIKENALLQEALFENKLLLSELQHRVKNNIQQILLLIKMSAGPQPNPETFRVVQAASNRLRAMATTQEEIYRNAIVGSISSKDFIVNVIASTLESHGAAEDCCISIQDLSMSPEEANCLSLIANELITNACKYGRQEKSDGIVISLHQSDKEIILTIEDHGPGFDPETVARTSGLLLVRGLCRQIGARLFIERDVGARCTVKFESTIKTFNYQDNATASVENDMRHDLTSAGLLGQADI